MIRFLIDFCEQRMHEAQQACRKRALKYGDKSWQWRWSFWQEMFWSDLGYTILIGGQQNG